MTNIPEEKLKYIISYKTDEKEFEFRQWFLNQFEPDIEEFCTLEEFAIYFLNTLRQYAGAHLNTNVTETLKCQTAVTDIKTTEEDVFTPRRLMDSAVKDFEMNSTPKLNTSTPAKHNTSKNSRKLSITPKSSNKRTPSGVQLGDFLTVINSTKNNRSSKKNTSPTTNQQSSQKTKNTKAKKRVQPISISKTLGENKNNSSIFAGESSFSNENNILKISNDELEDKNQCAVLAARKSLAMNASEITKEIKDVSIALTSSMTEIITTGSPVDELKSEEFLLDIKSLQNNMTLKRLAHIYSLIIDLNLVTNILNELAFLLNLLNVSSPKETNAADKVHKQENGLSMLEDASNAMYFALLCLEHQKLSLASLDAKSLSVVLINDRASLLNSDVENFLTNIYQQKQILAAKNPFSDYYLCYDSKTYNNVYFQHEHDSRENFTSTQEFTNFRNQRDLFYKCLRSWESNHLNPSWKFSSEIAKIIKNIFYISENCINMAHLAKLFVSQLLLSASNASSPEDIGLDVDLLKLSKLTQRLIAPSQFSVDYQFPRAEAFFRDFILEVPSLAFAEQLKMALCAQLTMQNNSSLDYINISKNENVEENILLIDSMPNFIVRPDILSSLLILAKFLGFTISLPYSKNSGNEIPIKIEQNQVRLRSVMQNNFDVYLLLVEAFEQGKLLIVIPWLVQYFAMLDDVTLQLKNYMKVLKLLFALYSFMSSENPKHFCTTSVFTIRLCLGWLFESKQVIAQAYYNYRAELKGNNLQESTNELEFIKSKLQYHLAGGIASDTFDPNPHLEALLPIACPFLAEFRVSIMPTKYAQTKLASRTGRYRHITTRLAEKQSAAHKQTRESLLANEQNENEKIQNSLIQAFLHSQTSSTLQIFKFCTERCYKSTIKDGQLKVLLPSKINADKLVNQIDSFQYNFVYNTIKTIYADAYAQVKDEWQQKMPNVLHKRISNALESLLPEDCSPVLKETYLMIIEKAAHTKMFDWFFANITDNYFYSNLHEMTTKICEANKNKVQLGSNQLTIIRETPRVSDLIDEFQYWLHCTSVKLDRFKNSKPIVQLFKNLILIFENELPDFLYHLLATGIIKILQNIISKNCPHMTRELTEAACQVCSHPNMVKALNSFSSNGICIYNTLVSKMFIDSFRTRKECFQHLELLIIDMIKQQIITVNYVNELIVSLLKYDFDPIVLTEISNMLKTIARETADVAAKNNEEDDNEGDVEKSSLFMEMLADLSRDVDFA